MAKFTEDDLKKDLETKEYEYGFYTDIEAETFPLGLNEDIVRAISKKPSIPNYLVRPFRCDSLEAGRPVLAFWYFTHPSPKDQTLT